MRLRGRMAGAATELLRAVEEARLLVNRQLEGECLRDLGRVLWAIGRVNIAERLYKQALAIARAVGDRESEGRVIGNLAIMHGDHGRLEVAHEMLLSALEIHRETGDRLKEGINLGNLGVFEYQQGHLERARQTWEEALVVHEDLGDRHTQGVTTSNLALVYAEIGEIDHSMQVFDRAFEIYLELDFTRYAAISLYYRGRIRRRIGDIPAARGDLERAGDLLRKVHAVYQLNMRTCEMGHLAIYEGRCGTKYLEEAEAEARRLGVRRGSQLEAAVTRLRKAQELFDESRTDKLLFGECIEDIPQGMRQWLYDNRPELRSRLETDSSSSA